LATKALVITVSGLVLVPLVMVVLGAARQAGGFSLHPLLTVLGSTTIITNTLIMGIGATLLSVIAGALLALVLLRIRTPGRAVLARLITLPLYITPLLTAIAWSWLGSPRGGLINLLAREGLGIDSLINLHTPSGVTPHCPMCPCLSCWWGLRCAAWIPRLKKARVYTVRPRSPRFGV
jgi:iron(III) transport system permease protein